MFNLYGPVRILAREKLSGIGEHWGVQLPNGQVAHLTPTGERIVSYEEFSQGRRVREVKRAHPKDHQEIVRRALASVRNPGRYGLLDRNCETYATWLLGEKPRSPQVEAALLVACAAFLLRFA